MARLGHVLTIGWRLRPSPTADGGGSSAAAADDDDEVEELTEAEFKRQSTRLVRRGVEVQDITKGGIPMKGLFTRYQIPACTFIGFFVGDWHSDASYEELINDENSRPHPRPFAMYSIRGGEEEIAGRIVHLTVAPTITEGATAPDPDRSRLFFANEPLEGGRANCILRELVLEADDLDGPPPNSSGGPFVAFALVSTVQIPKDHELTWHYGSSYRRSGYRAGAPTTERCDDFNIRDDYPGGVPVRAVSDYVPTGLDSSQSSADDPEYTGAALARLVM